MADYEERVIENVFDVVRLLGERYPDKNFQEDMVEFIDSVEVTDPEQLYYFIKQNHTASKTPPAIKLFWDYAYQHSLSWKRTKRKASFHVCDNCGHEYSNSGKRCPNCGSPYFAAAFGKLPGSGTPMQDGCDQCRVFGDLMNNPERATVYGPACEKFGGDWHTFPFNYCQGCKCRNCCLIVRRERYNPDGYKTDLMSGALDFKHIYGVTDTADTKKLLEPVRKMLVEKAEMMNASENMANSGDLLGCKVELDPKSSAQPQRIDENPFSTENDSCTPFEEFDAIQSEYGGRNDA